MFSQFHGFHDRQIDFWYLHFLVTIPNERFLLVYNMFLASLIRLCSSVHNSSIIVPVSVTKADS
jgi:hypothetical protein